MGTADKRERLRSPRKRSVSSYSEVPRPKPCAVFLAHAYFSRKRLLIFQYVSRALVKLRTTTVAGMGFPCGSLSKEST